MSWVTSKAYPDSNHHDNDKVDNNHSNVSNFHSEVLAWRCCGTEASRAAACIPVTEQIFIMLIMFFEKHV